MTLEIVTAGAARFGIALEPGQVDLMARFVDLLLDRNQRLNLTRIVDPAEVERRHLLDSLTCALPCLDALMAGAQHDERRIAHPCSQWEGQGEGSSWRCIDVGSGGGLPGILLAIAFPTLRMTLLESVGKKAAFLREAVADLGLGGVTVRAGRAEDAAREPAERDAYDLVVARALAPLPVALELCLPFARPGGMLVLPRGSDLASQLADGEAAAEQLAARLRPPIALDDPDLPPGRSLMVAEKLGPTSARFPRRPGMAAKRPLVRRQETGDRRPDPPPDS